MSPGFADSRMKLSTGPNFCAKPVKSSTEAPLLSRCAAIATKAPTVITPVPPTPVTSRLKGFVISARLGSASTSARDSKSICALRFLRRVAPSTVTKLGQKPFRQEKSLLHEDRLIWRLRPNGVSFGSTLRQLDSTEQSPHPSHTRSLM